MQYNNTIRRSTAHLTNERTCELLFYIYVAKLILIISMNFIDTHVHIVHMHMCNYDLIYDCLYSKYQTSQRVKYMSAFYKIYIYVYINSLLVTTYLYTFM